VEALHFSTHAYKTIIFRAVLYGCEKWFLKDIGEYYRFRAFENRTLRSLFGSTMKKKAKREEGGAS
jgi:hypothetical protein